MCVDLKFSHVFFQELQSVRGSIRKVENEIEALEKRLVDAEAKGDAKTLDYLRDKEKQLRDEKKVLREQATKLLDMLKSSMGGNVEGQTQVRVLRDYDLAAESLSPVVVPLELKEANPPEFITRKWRDEAVEEIVKEYELEDTETHRKAPTAFIRCSRGGKTRALYEVGVALKETLPHTAVISVSFNGASSLKFEEHGDPVGAFCRRVAFAARIDRKKGFEEFLGLRVTAEQVSSWLGSAPCILLIDELNLLNALAVKSQGGLILAEMLKHTFLKEKGRYFVFSSHISSLAGKLSVYMDSSVSERRVLVRQLPLIPKMSVARRVFGNSLDMNARMALFYGSIPALLYVAHIEEGEFQKRDQAISQFLSSKEVSDADVKQILRSIFSGRANDVPQALHMMMSAKKVDQLLWIPAHFLKLVEELSVCNSVSEWLKGVLKAIGRLFTEFRDAEENSGKAWERLFVVALLMRCAAAEFDPVILPLNLSDFFGCSVNLNPGLIELKSGSASITEAEDFVACINEPLQKPHISVFVPKHAQFKSVEVIVAAWPRQGPRQLYAYQLKQGNKRPHEPKVAHLFHRLLLIGGDAYKKPKIRNLEDKYIIATEKEIETFFGESGKQWTPKAWKELND